jgi:hypothetical protein
MICLQCDNEEFAETPNVEIEQEFKGESFKVRTAAQVCTMCGWPTVTPAQADELRRRTVEAYSKRHGLAEEKPMERRRCPICQRLVLVCLDGSLRSHSAFLDGKTVSCPRSQIARDALKGQVC